MCNLTHAKTHLISYETLHYLFEITCHGAVIYTSDFILTGKAKRRFLIQNIPQKSVINGDRL